MNRPSSSATITPSLMLSRIDCRIRVCFCSASCDAGQFVRALLGRRAPLGDALLERRVQRLQLVLRAQPLANLLLQFLGARLELVVRALQRRVALLNLRQHVLKPSISAPISSSWASSLAAAKFFCVDTRPHRALERQNRLRDDRLQPRRQQKRDECRAQHQDADDTGVAVKRARH